MFTIYIYIYIYNVFNIGDRAYIVSCYCWTDYYINEKQSSNIIYTVYTIFNINGSWTVISY